MSASDDLSRQSTVTHFFAHRKTKLDKLRYDTLAHFLHFDITLSPLPLF